MRLLNRVARLEAAMVPDGEALDIIIVLVPGRNSRPYGIEAGLQHIQYGELPWHRRDGESEDDFIARARSEAPPHPHRRGVRRFIADYAVSDDT